MKARRSKLAIPAALAFALAVVAAGSRAEDDPAPGPRKVDVPFELLGSKHMVVRAKLNGKGPFRLVFDLGSPVTLLGNDAARKAEVLKDDAPRSFLFAARGEAEVKSLTVGDLEAEDVPVLVMDHPALSALGKADRRRIDGLIGASFFSRFRTTIDYQAGVLSFVPVDAKPRNLMKDLPDRMAAPKVARHRVLAPGGFWGLTLGPPADPENPVGVPVATVLAGSPAALAGIAPGDVLTTLDGRWTTGVADTFAAAAGVAPGRAAKVVVLRDGRERTLTVTPRDGI